MEKKTLLMSVSALALLCGVASCGHEHEFATSWSKDATHHWHAAACEHAEEIADKAEHAWDKGSETKAPTEEAAGEKTYKCTVCDATKVEPIAKLEHTHKFAEAWASDDTHHWHAASCDHTGEVNGKAEHTWNAGEVTTAPTVSAAGQKTYECTVCGKEKTEAVAAITTAATSMSDLEALPTTAEADVYDFKFAAGSNSLSLEDKEQTVGETKYTKRIKTGGTSVFGEGGKRYISFTSGGKGQLTVVAKTGSGGDHHRRISLINADTGVEHDWAYFSGDDEEVLTLDFHTAGNYQIGTSNGCYIYDLSATWEPGVNDTTWAPATTLANADSFNVYEIAQQTFTSKVAVGNFAINAGAEEGQEVEIDMSNKKYGGEIYETRIKLDAPGTADYKSVGVTVSGRSRITVKGISDKETTQSVLELRKADGTLVSSTTFEGKNNNDKNTLGANIYTVEAAGTYYFTLAAESTAVNLFAFDVAPLPTEMTVTQALEAADDSYVSITATVSEINYSWSNSSKNMSVTLSDGTNELYVYKLASKVELNSVVTVVGYMDTYNEERQIAAGAEAEVVTPAVAVEKTIAETLELAKGWKVIVTGTVKLIEADNCVTITDGTNDLYCYKLAGEVVVGQQVKVTGYTDEYQGAKQLASGAQAEVVKVVYDEETVINLVECTDAIEGKKQAWNGLMIDATNGKFALNSSQDWIQVNTGTVITLNVGEGAQVLVNAYSSADNFEITEADGVVTIEAKANDYLKTISVTYPVVYDEETTIDVTQHTEKVEGTKAVWNGLSIDATNGKWANNNGGWIQVNTGTVVKLNVAEGAVVTVTPYYSADNFTIVVEDGVATITVTSNDYINAINVAYPTGGGEGNEGGEGGQVPEPTPTPVVNTLDFAALGDALTEPTAFGDFFTLTINVKSESVKLTGGASYEADGLTFNKQISLTKGKVTTTENGISFTVEAGKTATVTVYAAQKSDKSTTLKVLDSSGSTVTVSNLTKNGQALDAFDVLSKTVVEKYVFTLGEGTYHLGGAGGGAYVYGMSVSVAE